MVTARGMRAVEEEIGKGEGPAAEAAGQRHSAGGRVGAVDDGARRSGTFGVHDEIEVDFGEGGIQPLLTYLGRVAYPKTPRPSYADQVLALWRERGVKPRAVHEVRELQTALGLVAADSGICIVPASVERLRRDNVVYRRLEETGAVSPIIMSARKGDRSPEIGLILRLVKDMYQKEGIAFGR